MVAEEQEHRDRLRTLLDKHYRGSDFVLSPEEKHLVEGGPRSLHITDRRSFEEAVRGVVASEAMTARFYRQMEPHIDQPDVQAVFRELADEGVAHYKRLLQLAAENNIDIP
jgi:rubrerythrin